MFIIFSHRFVHVQIHVDDYVLNVHVNISGENALTRFKSLSPTKVCVDVKCVSIV